MSRSVCAGLLLCLVNACESSSPAAPDAGLSPPGWAVHYGDDVLRYDIEIDPDVWGAMLADPLCEGEVPCGDAYVEGTFRFGDQVVERVGVRLKGNTSRTQVLRSSDACAEPETGCPREKCPGWRRYSIKVHFGFFVESQLFDGIEKLNLNNVWGDPSYLREPLAYELFRGFDVPASRTSYVNVYVNGEHQGLFVSVQQVDRAFLEHEGFFNGKSGRQPLQGHRRRPALPRGRDHRLRPLGAEGHRNLRAQDQSATGGLLGSDPLHEGARRAA